MTATQIGDSHEVYDEGPLYAAARKVYPQKVRGTFRRIKWSLLILCLGIYYFLPFVRWDRGPNAATPRQRSRRCSSAASTLSSFAVAKG